MNILLYLQSLFISPNLQELHTDGNCNQAHPSSPAATSVTEPTAHSQKHYLNAIGNTWGIKR